MPNVAPMIIVAHITRDAFHFLVTVKEITVIFSVKLKTNPFIFFNPDTRCSGNYVYVFMTDKFLPFYNGSCFDIELGLGLGCDGLGSRFSFLAVGM